MDHLAVGGKVILMRPLYISLVGFHAKQPIGRHTNTFSRPRLVFHHRVAEKVGRRHARDDAHPAGRADGRRARIAHGRPKSRTEPAVKIEILGQNVGSGQKPRAARPKVSLESIDWT